MGLENMRRWPMYIVFAVCILLVLSLMNSWGVESACRHKIGELSMQLQKCSEQGVSCDQESERLLKQRDTYSMKVNELDKQKVQLTEDVSNTRQRLTSAESRANRSHQEAEQCKTDLKSMKTAQLDMRLEKDTLLAQLDDRKKRIDELEKEVEKFKQDLAGKCPSNPPIVSKITPAVQPPKQSAVLKIPPQMNGPALVDNNDAKEVEEEANIINDGNDVNDGNDGNDGNDNDYDPKLQ